MIDEQLEEQASLYVLGALAPDETQAFEAQLATNAELRAHVDALTETVAQIAHAAPQRALPPDLEARILAEIRETKITPITSAPHRTNWIPWAVAACLAVACVIIFADRQRLTEQLTAARAENVQSQSQLRSAHAENAQSQSQLAALTKDKERAEQQVAELRQRETNTRAQMATLADARQKAEKKVEEIEERDALADMQLATLTSKLATAPDATAAVVWDLERQRGVLNTANMPPNATNRDYQLWIVDPRYAQPVDAGVFSVERTGSTRYVFTPKSRITSATAFAISLERKGGVPKAEGPIVLAGK